MPDLANWVLLAENRAARAAVGAVADCLAGRRGRRQHNPLYLHGPPGSGKTHLVNALVAEATTRAPELTALALSALEDKSFSDLRPDLESSSPSALHPTRDADLLVIEDLQHLSSGAAEPLAALLDWRTARGRQVVLTSVEGPARLTQLPTRLTSRLAAGLVVGLLPLTPAGRVSFLQDRVDRNGLGVEPAVIGWLAKHTAGSGRQLERAIARLEVLARSLGRPPTLDEVMASFQEDAQAHRLTIDRIAQRVGNYFQVAPRTLHSRRRSRDTMLARQVGMYLTRRLTAMSLQQIGAYFGGRDHSTVLHACRKIEKALLGDVALSGVVHQLLAEVA